MIGVNDLEKANIFYDNILAELNIVKNLSTDRYIGYAHKDDPKKTKLYITKPFDKEKATNGNGTMIALTAKSKEQVDSFHAVAMQNGALNEGFPGFRPNDSKDYYAYIRDLNGNKICVFCLLTI